jgi:hypothetical protein
MAWQKKPGKFNLKVLSHPVWDGFFLPVLGYIHKLYHGIKIKYLFS